MPCLVLPCCWGLEPTFSQAANCVLCWVRDSSPHVCRLLRTLFKQEGTSDLRLQRLPVSKDLEDDDQA